MYTKRPFGYYPLAMHAFGQFPAPQMSLLHLSDTHLLGGDRSLFAVLETEKKLDVFFQRVRASSEDITAIVITGDLTDLGEPDAYRRLADIVTPHADALGAEVVWVMGNHDEREAFSRVLMGSEATTGTQDSVVEFDGLRLIVLDTTVPGYHHGELTAVQRDWLRAELASPAPRGTLLAMHHPPLPTPAALMGMIELDNQEDFWSSIEGSDVRGILAGHLHYTTFTASHGIPVSVAPGMCYTIDLFGSKDRLLVASDRGQTASLVSVYADQVVFSHIPVEEMPEVHGFPADAMERIQALSHAERREMFSNKSSSFNLTQDR
jgi:3',5'-cyclic AMP phosphodiesterase CpdA